MTISQLQYLIALEKFRHFGRAANSCGITQPTLSAQLQKLEDDLGHPLVNRKQQPLQLTELGEAIVQQARVILQSVEDIEELAAHWDQPVEGKFRLGVIPTVAPYLIHRFVGDVPKRFKSLNLEIREAQTEVVLSQLRQGLLDAAILAVPVTSVPDDWAEWVLYDEPFVAYVPKGHELSDELFLTNTELDRDDILVLPEGHCFRDQVLDLCQRKSKKEVTLEVGQLETLVRMADAGMGMTLLPELAVLELPMEKRSCAKPLAEPRPVRRIAMVQPPGHRKSGTAAALASMIMSHIPAKLLNLAEEKDVLKIN